MTRAVLEINRRGGMYVQKPLRPAKTTNRTMRRVKEPLAAEDEDEEHGRAGNAYAH